MLSGGGYSFDEHNVEQFDETMVFIGVIPNHWGHFLIDSVCRLWPFLEDSYKNFRIAYCGWNWPQKCVKGNFYELLELIGIDKKLLYIDKPIRVKKVIIPEPTMGFACNYHLLYRKTIDKISASAIERQLCNELVPVNKIYFTRTKNLKCKLNEVGEKEIERMFARVGFTVMAPEKMTLVEQIYYIKNCKEMAAMSGTIPHNAIFANPDMKLIILNRTPVVNPPQIRINKMMGIDCTYIDVYTKDMLLHPKQYGEGPITIEINNNLLNYFENREWKSVALPRYMWLIQLKNQIYYMILVVLKKLKGTSLYNYVKKFIFNHSRI